MQIVTHLPKTIAFGDWDWLLYCRILGHYWNQPFDEIYGGGIGRASSLKGEDGKFLKLDPNLLYKMIIPDKWKMA
jgi:hypothetical protein